MAITRFSAFFTMKGGSNRKEQTREAASGGRVSLTLRTPSGDAFSYDLELTSTGVALSLRQPGGEREVILRDILNTPSDRPILQYRTARALDGGVHNLN